MRAHQVDANTFDVTALAQLDTLQDLKNKISQETGILRTRQQFFLRSQRDSNDPDPASIALADDARTMADQGLGPGMALLSLRPRWHYVDRASRCITLVLPPPCAGAFESVLNFLCRDDADEPPAVDVAREPERALALL